VFVATGGLHTVSLAEGLGGAVGVGFWRLWPAGSGRQRQPAGANTAGVWGGVWWVTVCMAACGSFHTLLVTEEGVVWAFGRGMCCLLGLNNNQDRLVPTCLDPQRFGGAQFAAVTDWFSHSAAMTEDDDLFTWGRGEADSNDAGFQVPVSLGHPDLRNRLVPTLVSQRRGGGAVPPGGCRSGCRARPLRGKRMTGDARTL
jgi:alpha-tubulin suppressor-like RCC1 family protein